MNTSRSSKSVRFAALVLAMLVSLTVSAATAAQDDRQDADDATRQAAATVLFEVVFNGEDVNAPESLVAVDAVIQTPYGDFVGPEGLSEYLGIIRRSYPDASFDVTSITQQGDSVVVTWTMTASRYQIGPNEPTIHVSVQMSGQTALTLADGQVAGLTQTSETAVVRAPAEVAAITAPEIAFVDGASA